MNTKPYIIDDVIYHVPEKVAEDISELHAELLDKRLIRIKMQQQFNQLLEDYKELKKENDYLVRIINRDWEMSMVSENMELMRVDAGDGNGELSYLIPGRVKRYIEGLEKELEDLKYEIRADSERWVKYE